VARQAGRSGAGASRLAGRRELGLAGRLELGLAGKRALVTGASGGIGAAVARKLWAAGARVAPSSRGGEALTSLASEIGGTPLAADLADPGAARRLVAEVIRSLGGLDLVVAAAGIGWAGPLATMDPDELDHLLVVDLLAQLHLAAAAAPHLAGRRDAALVFVGSVAGHLGVGNEAAYSAAKGGLVAAASALAAELAPAHVGIVSPGPVDTAFFARRGQPYARSWPKPLAPERVASDVLSCVTARRPVVLCPGWLRVPVALQALAPGLYRRLAGRFA